MNINRRGFLFGSAAAAAMAGCATSKVGLRDLKPGEKRTVSFTLTREQFAQFGMDGRQSLARGVYTVFVGGGQPGYAKDVVSAQISL